MPVMQATNWLKAGPKRRIWSKGGVSSTKMGRQKRVKGAMPSQLLVHFKKLIWSSFRINLVPKIMVQFCYVTLYLGTETVSCRFLLLLMARMDMD